MAGLLVGGPYWRLCGRSVLVLLPGLQLRRRTREKKSSVILKVLKGNKVKMKNTIQYNTKQCYFLITVSIINYYFVIIFNYFDCKCSLRHHLQGVRSVGVEGTQVSTRQEWNDDPVWPFQLVKVHIWEERPPEPGIRTRNQNQDSEPGFRTGLVSAAGGGLTLP